MRSFWCGRSVQAKTESPEPLQPLDFSQPRLENRQPPAVLYWRGQGCACVRTARPFPRRPGAGRGPGSRRTPLGATLDRRRCPSPTRCRRRSDSNRFARRPLVAAQFLDQSLRKRTNYRHCDPNPLHPPASPAAFVASPRWNHVWSRRSIDPLDSIGKAGVRWRNDLDVCHHRTGATRVAA